jgi:hypothetical protein
VLVIAGGLAGMTGGLIVDAKNTLTRSRDWRLSVGALLIATSLIAVLLGLMVLLCVGRMARTSSQVETAK